MALRLSPGAVVLIQPGLRDGERIAQLALRSKTDRVADLERVGELELRAEVLDRPVPPPMVGIEESAGLDLGVEAGFSQSGGIRQILTESDYLAVVVVVLVVLTDD